MSEALNVVPQESVVDFPSDYEARQEVSEEQASPDAPGDDDDGPVSLDLPKADEDGPEASDETEASEGTEGEEEEAEPEVYEFDFGGNKLAVKKDDMPAEVADHVEKFAKDIWADYTKKSQANAEAARAIKARTEALAKIETLGGEALDAFTRGKSIKAEIEQLSAVNLTALWQSNPDQARRVSDTLAAKQAELQSIISAVDQHERAMTRERQAELKRRATEGKQKLEQKYRGFSTEIAPRLERYVQDNYGMTAEDAAQWALSPDVTEMAYKAMLYDQMRAAGKPKAAPSKSPPKPVKAMKNAGGAKGATNPNDMSFSELGKVLGIS